MNIEVYGYNSLGWIDATIAGDRMSVPDDMDNPHRQIIAQWEQSGNEIPARHSFLPSSAQVNAERDRRIDVGFQFGGKSYAFDSASKARVTGAATLAGFAVLAGAQPGDLFWHDGDKPFRFIANDNSENEMDAQTCFAFGQAAAAHEEAHIFAARAIKDMDPIPADYTADDYWP